MHLHIRSQETTSTNKSSKSQHLAHLVCGGMRLREMTIIAKLQKMHSLTFMSVPVYVRHHVGVFLLLIEKLHDTFK